MKSEETCRRLYQYFVQQRFINCRPDFLRGLELDGYCKKYELGFEYNGIQHYQFYPPFHRTKRHFEHQQERDYRKGVLCQRYGLHLMVIPYRYTFKTPIIADVIYKELTEAERVRGETYIKTRCIQGIKKELWKVLYRP